MLSTLLIPVSLLPFYYEMAGPVYAIGMLVLGIGMLAFGMKLWRTHADSDARTLLQASTIYLPLFFALILCDMNL
jgi:protoheme IX farnesyltransferase